MLRGSKMDSLQVGLALAQSKGSSRSQSPAAVESRPAGDPAATDDALVRARVQSPAGAHHEASSSASSSRHGSHHAKSHSRDLGSGSGAGAPPPPQHVDDSPQKRAAGAEYAAVYSPNVSYALSSADECSSPTYRGQLEDDYSNYYQGDEADGSGGGPSARAAAAIAHLTGKVARTKDLIRLEQTIRDDNVNEYLKLAASADKQQIQRIKAVFEKKNQKSAHCIAQLQKKLDTYHKRITNWEVHGSSSGQGSHRPPREVLRDMGQGLKNMGGNIRDGITGLGGSVMAAPREFAHIFTRGNRFGSADNISQLAAPAPPHAELRVCYNAAGNASSEGSRASEAGSAEGGAHPRGNTLPRAAPASPPRAAPAKCAPDDASPCSSVTSESGPYQNQVGSNNMSEAAYSIKPILNELRERREDYERLAERLDSLKNASAEVSFLSSALQEERFRTERLEEQINDLTELHQNEVENLKQALTDVEEKVQYQSEERLRDLHEALELCQTKIIKLEQVCAGGGSGAGGGGGAGGEAGGGAHRLPPRVLLVKLLNVALTLLQLVLLLVATVAGIAMPFLRTRVRVLTTSLAVVVGVVVLKRWPEVAQLSEHLLRRLRLYLADGERRAHRR